MDCHERKQNYEKKLDWTFKPEACATDILLHLRAPTCQPGKHGRRGSHTKKCKGREPTITCKRKEQHEFSTASWNNNKHANLLTECFTTIHNITHWLCNLPWYIYHCYIPFKLDIQNPTITAETTPQGLIMHIHSYAAFHVYITLVILRNLHTTDIIYDELLLKNSVHMKPFIITQLWLWNFENVIIGLHTCECLAW